MSVKVMGQVWDLELTSSQRIVLLALADHADHEGKNARPGIPLLAYKTSLSERQVQRVLIELTDVGILEIVGNQKGGAGRSRTYTIHLHRGVLKAPLESRRRTSATVYTREASAPKSPAQDNVHLAPSEKRVTSCHPSAEAAPPFNDDSMSPLSAKKGDISDSKRVTSGTKKGDIHTCAEDEPSGKPKEEPSNPPNPPSQNLFSVPAASLGGEDGRVVGLLCQFFEDIAIAQIEDAVRCYGREACFWQMRGVLWRKEIGRRIELPFSYWLKLLSTKRPLPVAVQHQKLAEARNAESVQKNGGLQDGDQSSLRGSPPKGLRPSADLEAEARHVAAMASLTKEQRAEVIRLRDERFSNNHEIIANRMKTSVSEISVRTGQKLLASIERKVIQELYPSLLEERNSV